MSMHGVATGCDVTVAGGALQTTVVAGSILSLGNPKIVSLTTYTHSANATGDVRYDLVAIDNTGIVQVLEGWVGSLDQLISAGWVPLQIVPIQNGATAPDSPISVKMPLVLQATDVAAPQLLPANSLLYTFTGTGASDTDPGVGNIACDGTTLGTVTKLFVSYFSADGTENERWLTETPPFFLKLWSRASSGNYVIYKVTAVAKHTNYDTLTVTLDDEGGPRGTVGAPGGWSVGTILTTNALDTILERDLGAVTSVFGRTGDVVAVSGDYTAAQVTNAPDKSSGAQQLFSGEIKAPDFATSGLAGATTAVRFVGGTTSGHPTSGTFSTGDWIVTQDGHIWICTAGGTPGTWVDPAAGGTSPTATNGEAKLAADTNITPINTFVDGPTTGSIGASGQTLLVMATVQLLAGASATKVTARLWDGTTVFAETEIPLAGSGGGQLELKAIVSPSAAATYKISCACTALAPVMKAQVPDNSVGGTVKVATKIMYVRLA